jgi:hypothetical protein
MFTPPSLEALALESIMYKGERLLSPYISRRLSRKVFSCAVGFSRSHRCIHSSSGTRQDPQSRIL